MAAEEDAGAKRHYDANGIGEPASAPATPAGDMFEDHLDDVGVIVDAELMRDKRKNE